jgi:uracil-DNA glycosylase
MDNAEHLPISNDGLSGAGCSTTWKDVLAGEKEQPYFAEVLKFVEAERSSGKTIYPKNTEVFNALTFTPFQEVKVVILGQDPYHGPQQAHGLCFSVKPPTPPPPSLVNIFLELQSDLGIKRPKHGCLEAWARQGVLLLNAVLTVEEGKAGSHANRGWERFTDRVIRELNDRREHIVFLLWGAYAQKKASFVDRTKHLVLEAPHPSPLSAHRGFLGCRHFSKANEYLRQHGIAEIRWDLSEVA